MSNKANTKWTKEKSVLKKLQMHFSFQQNVMRRIRYDAADASIMPSDIIRRIIGLPYTKVQRPRIGLSFNKELLEQLAEKYGLDAADEAGIQRRVIEEVNQHYQSEDDRR
ncbi:MAG: hypothetical protein KZQ89_15785 [Candidatus Thiodiazotropha sp. (ex Lucinoma kastoroae)]|nr:hypothetical protein [Candidatus Thiodiazotropha sp. (ex Rostrolucina anterorostrata)]MCU7849415.1 hypothetical protein [Candidatus Thiodiazotropha sp. (ex Lucinoma kastoroae)]MCU7861366.1 hypothetical protein [Candidatus Thiodiazotropha sp. (ex Lucinoma kastoroae)]